MLWHEKRPTDALPNAVITNVDQVCTVVRDFDAAIAGLTRLGIGPFKCWNVQPPALFERTFRGNSAADWTMRLGVALVGKTQWEVIMPAQGASLYREHLERFGEGVHHLLLETKGTSYEKSVSYFEQQGFAHAQTAALNLPLLVAGVTVPAAPQFVAGSVSTRFGYMDTVDVLKTTLELARFPPGVSRPLGIRIGKADFFVPADATNVESRLPNSLFDRVAKLTFVVNDLEATAAAWSSKAGVGPWHAVDLGPEAFTRVQGAGFADFRAKVAWAHVGEFLFELKQPVSGDTPHARALRTRGEGIFSVGLTSDVLGFADTRAALAQLGVPALLEGVLHGGYEFALLDATKVAGTWLELMQLEAAPLFEELKKLPGRRL